MSHFGFEWTPESAFWRSGGAEKALETKPKSRSSASTNPAAFSCAVVNGSSYNPDHDRRSSHAVAATETEPPTVDIRDEHSIHLRCRDCLALRGDCSRCAANDDDPKRSANDATDQGLATGHHGSPDRRLAVQNSWHLSHFQSDPRLANPAGLFMR
jgi:hypothetical protein